MGAGDAQRSLHGGPYGQHLYPAGWDGARRGSEVYGSAEQPEDADREGLPQFRSEREYGAVAIDPGICGGTGATSGELYDQLVKHAGECALCDRGADASGKCAAYSVEAQRPGDY